MLLFLIIVSLGMNLYLITRTNQMVHSADDLWKNYVQLSDEVAKIKKHLELK